MTNKVLIKLIIPEIDETFDMFIPINELVWKIKALIIKSVTDLTGVVLGDPNESVCINKDSAKIYGNNEIVFDTDVRNSSEIILLHTKV